MTTSSTQGYTEQGESVALQVHESHPFTGFDAVPMLIIALALIAMGGVLRKLTAR